MADAYLNFDTRMSTAGFKKGIGDITGMFKNLAATVGVALSVAAVVNFGKASVQAASEMEAKSKGLEFLMTANGRSMQEATGFIQEYTADGLVPMTSAYEAYKNMVSRGYDTSQIEQMLTVMKDAAVYNRQGQFSMGEAIEKATMGLRMENSLLTDSVGIQKNVAKMWDEFARSIGTTANTLTLAQKRQAEFNGFMKEGGIFAGAATQYTGTYAGRVAQLSSGLTNLKVSVGNAIIPLLNQIIPLISGVVTWFTRLFNIIGQVMNLLFGTNVSMASLENEAQGAADATGALSDNTEQAGEAAKGALASFDKLDVLAQPTGGGGGGGGAGGGGGGGGPMQFEEGTIPQDVQNFGNKIKNIFEDIKTAVMNTWNSIWNWVSGVWTGVTTWIVTAFNDVVGFFVKLWDDPKGTTKKALDDIAGWITDLISKIVTWFGELPGKIVRFVQEVGPKILNWLSTAWNDVIGFLGTVLSWIGEFLANIWRVITGVFDGIAEWVYENVVSPVVEKIKEKWGKIAEWFNEKVLIPVKNFFTEKWDAIKDKVNSVWDSITGIWEGAKDWFNEKVLEPIAEFFLETWENVKQWVIDAWENIKTAWQGAKDWFNDTVLVPIRDFFTEKWDAIKDKVSGVWDGIKDTWGGAKDWFQTTIIDPLVSAWSTATEDIGGFFSGLWGNIEQGFQNVLGWFTDKINWLIERLNGLSDFMGWDPLPLVGNPGEGGVPLPPKPYLPPTFATGAVIPPNAPFTAILGDQRAGTNIEAPEALLRQIVRDEMRGMNGQPQTIHNVLKLDGRVVYESWDRENRRIGGSMISKGATA